MDITPELSAFLAMAFKKAGLTQAQVAQKLGVQIGTVNRWVTGNGVRTIRPQNWEDLQALLSRSLPNDLRTELLRQYTPQPASALMAVQPIVGLEALQSFDPMCKSVRDLRADASGKAMFETVGEWMFAFRLADDDMAPVFPKGTIVLVKADSGLPPSGALCLVAIREGKAVRVVCRLWYATEGSIELRAIAPGAKDYKWAGARRQEASQAIVWRYPVMEIAERLKWA